MKFITNYLFVILVIAISVDSLELIKKPENNNSINNFPTNREPSIQAYGLPKKILSNNGNIERINLMTHFPVINLSSDIPKSLKSSAKIRQGHPIFHSRMEHNNIQNKKLNRQARSIDENTDLQAEESKVFRPLFVYRQQQARKQQFKNRKNKKYYGEKKKKFNKNNSYYSSSHYSF
ncbi:uncharacterized protein LOC122850196 [Aphidius gifuensis]|uniref:uncharacterized protein LOC122850196 n=1 Tax=Aphidius gifuensis TaxID=684658 RepID=UPI001CDC5523|nr:uncharacterized protein LOC122850196 [Aphidius gifuensis]